MKYLAKIGLEMHCEISETNSKVFSPSANTYSELPNSNVNQIDMAFPGVLPLINKEAVKKALMASMILNCSQPEYMYFERKNYYYPDLPKGFQLTQESKPIPVGIYGLVEYECNGETKQLRIDNIHLEEDTASLDHYYDTSNIDYNRAGVPLLELVTAPDLHSADEAVAFLEHMRRVYQYANISKADSKKGQVRCDVNISIMDASKDENDPVNWGVRNEIKNVNSFSAVRDAINYEIQRQIDAFENGEEIQQQTRRWDDEKGITVVMRDKADAIDYKFFVEPNIPKFKLSKQWLEEIKNSIPELAHERKSKYINELGLSDYDASILIKEKNVSDYFEECLKLGIDSKTAANWVSVIILGEIKRLDISIDEFYLRPNMLMQIINGINKGLLSSKQAKEVFFKSIEEKKEPSNFISTENAQISDEGQLNDILDKILSDNSSQVEAYKNGKTNLFDFFVGQVMKETRGKANPNIVKELLNNKLKN